MFISHGIDEESAIRSPKFKLGHCDPLKVKLDSFEVQGVSYTCCPPGMYYAHNIPKMFKLGHIDLIKSNYQKFLTSSPEFLMCHIKLVSRSNLALTSLVCDLQKSSNVTHMTTKLRSSGGKHHDTY